MDLEIVLNDRLKRSIYMRCHNVSPKDYADFVTFSESIGNSCVGELAYKSALCIGRLDIMQYLYEKKVRIPHSATVYAVSAIIASEGGYYDCLEFLLAHNCPHNYEASILAAREGLYKVFELMIRYKYKFNKHWCIYFAQMNGHRKVIDMLIKK